MTVNPFTHLSFAGPEGAGINQLYSFPVWSSEEGNVAIYQDVDFGWRFHVGASLTITNDPGDIPNQPPPPVEGYTTLKSPTMVTFNWSVPIENT